MPEELSDWQRTFNRLQKVSKDRPPKVIAKRRKQLAEDAYYKAQQAIRKKKDSYKCRICGAGGYTETHHVERRSSFGSKEVLKKHHHSNLLTVCAGPGRRAGKISCHDQLTGKAMKAVSTTARGTNGPVFVTKFDEKEGGYVVFRENA